MSDNTTWVRLQSFLTGRPRVATAEVVAVPPGRHAGLTTGFVGLVVVAVGSVVDVTGLIEAARREVFAVASGADPS